MRKSRIKRTGMDIIKINKHIKCRSRLIICNKMIEIGPTILEKSCAQISYMGTGIDILKNLKTFKIKITSKHLRKK